jgi:ribosomal protein L6P/L9E
LGWGISFLRGLGSWVLAKLRFKGKSFRWYKKRGSLVLRFGHSHLVVSIPSLRHLRWRRRGRMKIIFYGSDCRALIFYLATLVRWRPMNIYHGRGLRLSRQRVVRKSGKVSAYR